MHIIIRDKDPKMQISAVSYLSSANEESLMHAFLLVMSSGVLSLIAFSLIIMSPC